MSFPSNPGNNTTATVNGIVYRYNVATNSWRREFNNVLDRFFLVGRNNASNTYTGDLVVYGGASIGMDLFVGGQILGIVSTATNLSGGSTGTLFYQSAPGVTARLPISPTTGSILVSTGSIPVWSTSSGNSYNLQGGNTYEIPFQSATNVTAFSSSLIYRYDLGQLEVTTATNSTNTSTGAIVSKGGLGVALDANIGGNLTVKGTLTVEGTSTVVQSASLEVTDKTVTIAKGSANSAQADGGGIIIDGANASILWNDTFSKLVINRTVDIPEVIISSTASSTNLTSGALRVSGGVGIYGKLNVGNDVSVIGNITPFANNTFDLGTNSLKWNNIYGNSVYVGSVRLNVIGGQLYADSQPINAGASTSTAALLGGSRGSIVYQSTANSTAFLAIGSTNTVLVSDGTLPVWSRIVNSITAGTSTFISTSKGDIIIWSAGGSIDAALSAGNSTTNVLRILNTSSSISTTTGALTVVGGIGIGGNLIAGGAVEAVRFNDLIISNTSATHVTVQANEVNQTMRLAGQGSGILEITTTTQFRSLQKSAVIELTAYSSSVSVSLTESSFTANMIVTRPQLGTSDLNLPAVSAGLAGVDVVITNRSVAYSLRVRLTDATVLTTVTTGTARRVLCDGFRWYAL